MKVWRILRGKCNQCQCAICSSSACVTAWLLLLYTLWCAAGDTNSRLTGSPELTRITQINHEALPGVHESSLRA